MYFPTICLILQTVRLEGKSVVKADEPIFSSTVPIRRKSHNQRMFLQALLENWIGYHGTLLLTLHRYSE